MREHLGPSRRTGRSSRAADEPIQAAADAEQRSPSADPESPTVWLSRVLREAHLSNREASKLIGREESYFWQMLQKGRSRSLPTPEELAGLVPRLRGVTLLEALEKVWKIERSQIVSDLAMLAARGEADATWGELDPADKERLDAAIRAILSKSADRQCRWTPKGGQRRTG